MLGCHTGLDESQTGQERIAVHIPLVWTRDGGIWAAFKRGSTRRTSHSTFRFKGPHPSPDHPCHFAGVQRVSGEPLHFNIRLLTAYSARRMQSVQGDWGLNKPQVTDDCDM